MSNHYTFDGPLGDKGKQNVNLISIPSIIYGSKIKKGTVDLKFYVSGTIVGQLKDENKVPDKVIQEKLGLEEEEVERLHDQSGMTKRGSKKTFNTGWRPKR